MGVSKVDYCGRTLVDLTADTVVASALAAGYTAHGADGEPVVGTMEPGDPTFTLRYLSGDEGATGEMPDEKRVVGYPIAATKNAYRLQDCTFDGWLGSDGASYADMGPVPGNGMEGQTLTLMAQWLEPIPDYETSEEWAADIPSLKRVALDIAEKAEGSDFWGKFYGYMQVDADFTLYSQKLSYPNPSLKFRLVGMNCKETEDGGVAGLTFMMKHARNSAQGMGETDYFSGGWASSTLRTYLNSGSGWTDLPSVLRDACVSVKNVSYGSADTYDKQWIPSWYELCGSDTTDGYKSNDGPQLPFFAQIGTDCTNADLKAVLKDLYKTIGGGNPSSLYNKKLWTRSRYPGDTSVTITVTDKGEHSWTSNSNPYSVVTCISM